MKNNVKISLEDYDKLKEYKAALEKIADDDYESIIIPTDWSSNIMLYSDTAFNKKTAIIIDDLKTKVNYWKNKYDNKKCVKIPWLRKLFNKW